MSDTKNKGGLVPDAWRGFFLGVGSTLVLCFLEVIDSLMEDIADLFFIEQH